MSRFVVLSLARHQVMRIWFGFTAFIIYACTTLLSNQGDQVGNWPSYDIERTGIASAITNIVYGAPIATVYRGLFNTFAHGKEPLIELIQQAEQKQIGLGDLLPYVPDGIGMGQAVFTTVAMRIFGLHPWSIVVLFLILMGVTTLAFLGRFRDQRSVAVILVFLVLTIMFASPLGTYQNVVSQVPVGGYRYFSLLAVIPCLHILFELIGSIGQRQFGPWSLCLLMLQLLVFMIVYFINIASIYVFGPLVLAGLYAFIVMRGASQRREILLAKILVVVGVVSALLLTFALLIPQAYRDTGRARSTTTWHHIIIGFGENPNWPFGDLADRYKGCWPGNPDSSFLPGLSDMNGGCFWAAYAKRHELTENQIGEGIYDKDFNTATKEGVIEIVKSYPLQALVTFVYYKPLWTLQMLAANFRFSPPVSRPVDILIICQIILFLAFAVFDRDYLSFRALKQVYSVFALCALSTSGLYIVAYSNPFTTADLFFYILALVGTMIASIVAQLIQSLWPASLAVVDVGAKQSAGP